MHPRTRTFNAGRLEMQEAVLAIASKYELTPLECIRAILEVVEQQTRFALRMERHGTYEKKADEE